MPLAAGTRLGQYEISGFLGAGGMGQVYLARDTKLEREVAVKVLQESVAYDAERVARLRREARVLAALNHPNIAAVYDLVETDAQCALVLELVPGLTLAERILHGPLAPREALEIAGTLADALDAAHGQGIIHRDLKPANVKITPDGRLKLLDFGLARPGLGDAWRSSEAPTAQGALTGQGVVTGTLAYMSPEQLRGGTLDKRTDIWAFGCVLYELLTARPVFGGNTADVIASILGPEPDVSSVDTGGFPGARTLLARCLRHDPRRRLRDIGDGRLDIDDMLASAPLASEAGETARRPGFQRLTDALGINESPALSPDRKMVAFVAVTDGRRQIHVRMTAGGAPLRITNDDAHRDHPRWTPDSSALVVLATGGEGETPQVFEVPALGGFPRALSAGDGGVDVSHDGSRLAFFGVTGGVRTLVITDRDGEAVLTLASLPQASTFACPRWSPDDRWIAFTADESVFDQRIYVVASSGGPVRTLARGAMLKGCAWLPDSSGLVYSSSSGSTILYPPTFNLRTVALNGGRDRPLTAGDVSYVDPDVHSSGQILVSRLRSESDIWSFPIEGSPQENTRASVRITHQTGQVQTPSASPDGRRIVYLSDNGDHGNLWVGGLDGGAARQITFERDPAVRLGVPVWSPAGNRIVYVVTREGRTSLWVIAPDGSGRREIVESGFAAGWSADGQWLYYTPGGVGAWRIQKVPVAGGEPVLVRDDDSAFVGAFPGGTGIVCASRHLAGVWDWRILKASPENGPVEELACLRGHNLPLTSSFVHTTLSPDGLWLATPLTNGVTTNIWLHSTTTGEARQVTDFGDRPTMIARRVAWTADSGRIYAAVATVNADVVLLDGLI